MNATETTTTNVTPISERTILVHKKDAEGSLTINALTGHILTEPGERPDWSEGLTLALMAERHGFYSSRLGHHYSDEMKKPDALSYEDLGWIGVDAAGDPIEIEADAEHRMTVISEILGIERTDDLSTPTLVSKGRVLAEVEIAMDKERTAEEHAAFEHAQEVGFKDGTNG